MTRLSKLLAGLVAFASVGVIASTSENAFAEESGWAYVHVVNDLHVTSTPIADNTRGFLKGSCAKSWIQGDYTGALEYTVFVQNTVPTGMRFVIDRISLVLDLPLTHQVHTQLRLSDDGQLQSLAIPLASQGETFQDLANPYN